MNHPFWRWQYFLQGDVGFSSPLALQSYSKFGFIGDCMKVYQPLQNIQPEVTYREEMHKKRY